MNNQISQMIDNGYKIINFKRKVDLLTNEEYGSLELKALDGYIQTIDITSDQSDEVEKVLFRYLQQTNL